MTPRREQIFAWIESELVGRSTAQEVERMPSSDPAKFPAFHIFDEGDEPDEDETGCDNRILTARIEGYVEGGNGAAAHAAANALYAEAIEILFVEPVLNGLAEEINQGSLKPAVANLASKRRIGFDLTLTIHYQTPRGEPEG